MGKQKYPTTDGGVTTDGTPKQRDHTKTGKLQKRRETRRLEAMARQVERIQGFERDLEKAKNKGAALAILTHAQLTLQKIRGGTPEKVLNHKFKTATEKETDGKVIS